MFISVFIMHVLCWNIQKSFLYYLPLTNAKLYSCVFLNFIANSSYHNIACLFDCFINRKHLEIFQCDNLESKHNIHLSKQNQVKETCYIRDNVCTPSIIGEW